MAFAFVPINEDLKAGSKNWLSMGKADELVCELLNKPVDKKFYCNNWFDQFFYFDWYTVKGTKRFESNEAYVFGTADEAVMHYFKCSLYTPSDGYDFWTSVECTQKWVKENMEPIIRMFYDKGYKIVSLNQG